MTTNEFLALSWTRLSDALGEQVEAAVRSWRLNPGDPSSMHVSDARTVANLRSAPGFADVAPGAETFSLTLQAPAQAPWSLKIMGVLDGSTGLPDAGLGLSHVHHPFHLTIDQVSLSAKVVTDAPGARVPTLRRVEARPYLRVTSDFLNISAGPDQWIAVAVAGRPPDRTVWRVDCDVNIGALFPSLGSTGATGHLLLDLFGTPFATLVLDTHVFGEWRIVIVKDPPPNVGGLLGTFAGLNLPISWGQAAPNAPPAPAVPLPSEAAAWEAKAAEVEKAIPTHLISADDRHPGVIFNKRFQDGAWVSCDDGRDAAIWTGHYLAATAFRAAKAKGQALTKALASLGRALDGLEMLFRVPQEAIAACRFPCANLGFSPAALLEGLFCRAVYPVALATQADPPFGAPPADKAGNYYADPVEVDGVSWRGFGRDGDAPSRDQITGVALGLSWAAIHLDTVSGEATGAARTQAQELRDRARDRLDKLLNAILGWGWGFPTPSGQISEGTVLSCRYVTSFCFVFLQQLALLRAGAAVLGKTQNRDYPTLYAEAHDAVAHLAWLSPWISALDPLTKYYKFNLDWGMMGLLLYLEQDADRRRPLEAARDVFRAATGHHRNAHFNLMYALTDPEVLGQKDGYDGSQTVGGETLTLLAQWLARRDRATVPGGEAALPGQKTPFPDYLGTNLGRDARQLVKRTRSLLPTETPRLASTFALPVHVRPGDGMDFLDQRDPFTTGLSGQDGQWVLSPDSDPSLESPGIDFLLPYAVADYLGVFATEPPAAIRNEGLMLRAMPAAVDERESDLHKYLRVLDSHRKMVDRGLNLREFAKTQLAFVPNPDVFTRQSRQWMADNVLHGLSPDERLYKDKTQTFRQLVDAILGIKSVNAAVDVIWAAARGIATGDVQAYLSGIPAATLMQLPLDRLGVDTADLARAATEALGYESHDVAPPLPWDAGAFEETGLTVLAVASRVWDI